MKWRMALPMYNVSPALRTGYEALALALLERLHADGWHGEAELVRETGDLAQFWQRPDLLLSQACGYPYMTALRGRVRLLATPRYALPGCSGADYCSVILAREAAGLRRLEDARGGIAAVNDLHSHSGMNALRHATAPLAREGGFFSAVKVSGSHAASLALLQSGAADVAAIDCVTLAYVKQEAPASLQGLAALQLSASAPGLPFVASSALPAEVLALLRMALLEPDDALAAAMRSVHIEGFSYCDEDDYARVLRLEREAHELGYAQLG